MGLVMTRRVTPTGGTPPPVDPGGGVPPSARSFLTDQTGIYPCTDTALPSLFGSYVDPVFGGTVTKITDPSQSPAGSNVGHNYPTFGVLFEYASQAPVSKDGTWIYVVNRRTSSSGDGDIRRVSTGEKMVADLDVPTVEAEFRWSPTDDNVGYFMRSRWACRVDMPAGTITQLYTVPSLAGPNYTFLYTDAEGGPDFAFRYHALMGKRTGYPTEWVIYDRQAGSVRSQAVAKQYANFIKTTPLTGQLLAGGDQGSNNTNLYDQDQNFLRRVHYLVAHGDVAVGSDGEEYFVYVANIGQQPTEAGGEGLARCRLSDATRTVIPGVRSFPRSAMHISGICSYTHPDWVTMSHYTSNPTIDRPGHHEVWFMNFMTGEVKRICHTHNYPDPLVAKDYWSECQATTTWDGTKVYFKSNWRTTDPGLDISVYRVTGNFW